MLKDSMMSVASDVGPYISGVGRLLDKSGWIDKPEAVKQEPVTSMQTFSDSYVARMKNSIFDSHVEPSASSFSDAFNAVSQAIGNKSHSFESSTEKFKQSFDNQSVNESEAVDKSEAYLRRAQAAMSIGSGDSGFDFTR